MKKALLILPLLFALAAMQVSTAQAEPKKGDAAPDFSLKGSDGKMYKLKDMKGKVVVIAWFPKAFTGGCTKECKSLRAEGEAIRKFGDVAYFTASCDTVELNTKFAKSLDLDYPILSDPSKKVAMAYGVVHAKRKVPERWTFYIGPDQRILLVDKMIDTSHAGTELAENLKKLGVGTK